MDPDEVIAALEAALANAEARAEAAEAQVEEMQNGVRNSPLNWFRDNPGVSSIIAGIFILVIGTLVLVLRNVDITVTLWLVLLASAVVLVGLTTYFVLSRWSAQHQLDHPAAP
jgi:fumarate reductase subunit D